jgi:hypothetical protein
VCGVVAGSLALNRYSRLATLAKNLFSEVEGRWSPLCSEDFNLWSVRDLCPSVEHMTLIFEEQIP